MLTYVIFSTRIPNLDFLRMWQFFSYQIYILKKPIYSMCSIYLHVVPSKQIVFYQVPLITKCSNDLKYNGWTRWPLKMSYGSKLFKSKNWSWYANFITIKANIWIRVLSNSLLGPQSHFLIVGLQYKFSSEKHLNSSTQSRKISWIQQDTIKSDELSVWAYATSKRKQETKNKLLY